VEAWGSGGVEAWRRGGVEAWRRGGVEAWESILIPKLCLGMPLLSKLCFDSRANRV